MPASSNDGSPSGSGGGGGGGGSYTQTNRPLMIHTPLGADKLLLIGVTGEETISQLFSFRLETLSEKTNTIDFSAVLGQKVTACVQLPDLSYRYFNGFAVKMAEGARGTTFTEYSLEIVPELWLLTRKTQSRIFQQLSVPDILKTVFTGMNVSYQIQGTFQPRDYCVQYRETDFNFASRLMEEEGIYYYFEHSDGDHQMIVANTPSSHADLATNSSIIYEGLMGGERDDDRILSWTKTQELRSGKSTRWDYSFELPTNNLEAKNTILPTVAVGTVTHSLSVGNNSAMELYDFPGQYAQRFDGISPGGGEQPDKLQDIFTDNARTVGLRMQEEAFPSIIIEGRSDCRQMNTGHKFTLTRHPNANGDYVLLSVWHSASVDVYRTSDSPFSYTNNFTAFPFALPFVPACVHRKPTVHGTQTALVVGPSGNEIFTDKYGRVKVQFYWDRVGTKDANSSCWVRVTQPTAGSRWGSSFWPRMGQEVVVAFEHGDPDTPIIVGTVYNANQMPPYLGQGNDSKHPNDNKVSGFKTCSTMGGDGYNELRFDDTKGTEEIYVHAERNYDERVEQDRHETIGNNRSLIVGSTDTKGDKTGDQMEEIYKDKHLKIHGKQEEEIGSTFKLHVIGDTDVLIDAGRKTTIGVDEHTHTKGDRKQKVDGNTSLTIGGKQQEKISASHLVEAGTEIHFKAGTALTLEAGTNLTIKVGGNFISISSAGVTIVGTMVNINSGGAAGTGTDSSPDAPDDAAAATPAAPVVADTSVPGAVSVSS